MEDSNGGGVGNDRSDGMGQDWGVDSVSHKRGGVDDGADSVRNNSGSVDSVSDNTDSGAVGGLPGVADVLDDAVSVVGVGHGLDPAVGEVDGVAAGGGVPVPLLGLGEGGSAVVVSHAVVVGVDWGLSQVSSGVTGGGGHNNASGEGGGDTEKSSADESLQY